MKIFIFILLGIFLSVGAKIPNNRCEIEIIGSCVLQISQFAREFGNIFPGNEIELTRQCQIFQEVRSCIYNYSRKCVTSTDKAIHHFSYNGTADKMKEFCNPSKQLYKDYLEKASCIKRNYGDVMSCFRDNLSSLLLIFQDYSKDKAEIFCCALNNLRRCILTLYESKCGAKVIPLMKLQIEFIYSEWIIEMCNPYFHLIEDCTLRSDEINLSETNSFEYLKKYFAPLSKS
ncbi:uncharacterized protein [Centruroides vittatus]|uniref:uncharacterized protein n=1 Tax=Centruroides vittatus TaxID=120091 RepID=UPI00350E9092